MSGADQPGAPETRPGSAAEGQPTGAPGGKYKRPFSVTLLALGVLILAGLNLLRFEGALGTWGFIRGLSPWLPPYLSLTGLLWGVAGLVLFWGLWRGRGWAPRLARWTGLLYAGYYWADRIFLSRAAVAHVNRVFAAGASLVLLLLVFWVLSRRKAKAFFGIFRNCRGGSLFTGNPKDPRCGASDDNRS